MFLTKPRWMRGFDFYRCFCATTFELAAILLYVENFVCYAQLKKAIGAIFAYSSVLFTAIAETINPAPRLPVSF